MRRLPAIFVATVTLASAVRPAPAETEVELRASTTEYRFLDLSHTRASGLVLDAVYVDVPGLNQLFVGAGYEFEPAERLSLIPMLYAVSGSDTHGVAVGGLVSLQHGGWQVLGFVGHFFQTGGEVSDYTFVDSLDLTRMIGRWEVGGSVDAYETEGEVAWRAGPTLKRNDTWGAWGMSALFGDEREFRLIRAVTF